MNNAWIDGFEPSKYLRRRFATNRTLNSKGAEYKCKQAEEMIGGTVRWVVCSM